MKFWKLILVMLIIGGISITMIAFNPFSEKGKQNRLERKCLDKIETYTMAYNKYLLMKYDDVTPVYYSDVVTTSEIYVKENCLELYEEYIIPIKTKWDPLKYVPIEKTLLEGVPESVMKYRLKYKEIDKAKTKIKVKKSSDVDISNYQNTTVVTDSIN